MRDRVVQNDHAGINRGTDRVEADIESLGRATFRILFVAHETHNARQPPLEASATVFGHGLCGRRLNFLAVAKLVREQMPGVIFLPNGCLYSFIQKIYMLIV